MEHPVWIWQYRQWPHFCWNNDILLNLLVQVHEQQGRLLGKMSVMGFETQAATSIEAMTEEVVRNAEIEGLILNAANVRSSVAQHLGLETAGLPQPDHYTEGVVQVLMDAVRNHNNALTEERLFNWHAALFPTGRSGMIPITVGGYRTGVEPMQVVSGAMGKEQVHYEAPPSERVQTEMDVFLDWLNTADTLDPLLKAGMAHLWFVNIHPFDDGNGRLARTITDMLLARADGLEQRFYSMSAAILKNKNAYYESLEYTGKHGLDITPWLTWFLQTLRDAIETALAKTDRIVQKTLFWQRQRDVALNERQIKIINRLWDGLEGKLSTGKWAKMTHTSQATALRDIQDLVEKGILHKTNEAGRSTNYELTV
ncbi:MAG: Fic family protein [Paludibacteraceae bacterium]|nr:Fic family protein [Paludibacteraceae bacterium]